MALPDDAAGALAQRFGGFVSTLARAQFERMLGLIRGGMDARKAIEAVQVEFTGAFADQLAAAFSELLQRSVGVAELRAMPVGGISLSRRLYLHNVQTAGEVAAVIRKHAQGVQDARKLALQLYDGYDPKDGIRRPLEGLARADLPKALRELTADPAARAGLSRLVELGQQQAARLKSSALRAAYSEAFDAWEAGAGEESLKRRLDVAAREKNRYFANRIAQTELARAHQADKAAELLADETIDVVQVLLNPAHPVTDICDLHGRADLYGLGPGCYPKGRAPVPPFHPHCWCRLRSRPDLRAAMARPVPGGEGAHLRSLLPDQAARVMGSRDRAQAVLDGASVDSVVNAGKDPLYRLRRLGDPGTGHALVKHAQMPHPASDYTGQRPGLFDLPPVRVTTLSGDEFGAGLSRRQLAKAADAELRRLQASPGLHNADTGWMLAINKKGRKKMGDNADQTPADSMAIAGLKSLVRNAVVAERHADDAHRNPDVEAVLRLYAPVEIGGRLYRAKLTVKAYRLAGEPKYLHALSSAEIENAPLGIFPSYSIDESIRTDQPTTGRAISISDLLRGAQRQDGTPFNPKDHDH